VRKASVPPVAMKKKKNGNWHKKKSRNDHPGDAAGPAPLRRRLSREKKEKKKRPPAFCARGRERKKEKQSLPFFGQKMAEGVYVLNDRGEKGEKETSYEEESTCCWALALILRGKEGEKKKDNPSSGIEAEGWKKGLSPATRQAQLKYWAGGLSCASAR